MIREVLSLTIVRAQLEGAKGAAVPPPLARSKLRKKIRSFNF